jgi:hypothetical protein
MGHVRTIPQNTQDGGQSGQVSLEITYGGKESPFGGIDTSAPPAYIDPRCFTDVDGFLVIDNQLILGSIVPYTIPELFNGLLNITFLKMGTFYTSNLGFINYALGMRVVTSDFSPKSHNYSFYMTAWSVSGFLIGNDLITVQLQETTILPVAASLTIPIVAGQPDNYTDSGSLVLIGTNNGIFTASASSGYVGGTAATTVVAKFNRTDKCNAGVLIYRCTFS